MSMILTRNKSFSLIACFVLLTALFSCQDENSYLGESLVESSFRNVFTDTCRVDISTILVDSLKTLGDSVTQIGYYEDSVFGKVTSSFYAEYNKASFSVDDGSTYTFDSITLNMTPSGHYWGDTLVAQRINVYKLSKAITLNSEETLYNTSKVTTEDSPLFSFLYKPKPNTDNDIEVRMPDKFGKQLFEDILSENEALDSQDKFREYFHGLAFKQDNYGSCITGFMVNDSSMYMKVYYHESNNTLEEKELIYTVNTDYSYTHVEHDRSSSQISQLIPGQNNSILSYKTGKRAYLQGLTGIYNSIEFPYLNNIQVAGDIVSIESATLYLYPLKNSYGKYSQLPSTLRLYIADDNNNTENQVYDSMGTTIQNGNLVVDNVFGDETYYSFDLTSFMQDNLGTWGMNRKKLFLILDDDDFVCTFDQVVFSNDHSKESGQVRLDIRYKAYNK